MTTTGQRLGAAQVRGHRLIDAVYADLATEADAIVRRYVSSDSPLTEVARIAILGELRRTLTNASPALFAAISTALDLAAAAALVDIAPVDGEPEVVVAAAIARQQVRESIVEGNANAIAQTGRLLTRMVATGAASSLVATAVRQYFSPLYAPRRDRNGVLQRARQGAVASWPGRAGMASARARLVMLSESTSMHFVVTRASARRDGVLIRYTLSIKHLERDPCDENARRDVGYGPGLYLSDEAPRVPVHPRCRCYYERSDKIPFPVEQMIITGKRRGFPIP